LFSYYYYYCYFSFSSFSFYSYSNFSFYSFSLYSYSNLSFSLFSASSFFFYSSFNFLSSSSFFSWLLILPYLSRSSSYLSIKSSPISLKNSSSHFLIIANFFSSSACLLESFSLPVDLIYIYFFIYSNIFSFLLSLSNISLIISFSLG